MTRRRPRRCPGACWNHHLVIFWFPTDPAEWTAFQNQTYGSSLFRFIPGKKTEISELHEAVLKQPETAGIEVSSCNAGISPHAL